MAMVNMNNLLNGKDSRWLQLEVCREFQRNKCSRSDTECKFAHPPANVEVQNGRVTACYDSIKGRCNREKPPCKYFHPPQHLKDQLLINGRNHLALKNALMQQMGLTPPGQPLIPGQVPAVATNPYLTGMPQVGSTFSPYFTPGPVMPAILGPDPASVGSPLGVVPQTVVAQQKMPRSDRLEMDMKTVGSFYYESFAFPGMVPYKRPAADKSGMPVYQPNATTYQQLMQLQQPFVPVSCEYQTVTSSSPSPTTPGITSAVAHGGDVVKTVEPDGEKLPPTGNTSTQDVIYAKTSKSTPSSGTPVVNPLMALSYTGIALNKQAATATIPSIPSIPSLPPRYTTPIPNITLPQTQTGLLTYGRVPPTTFISPYSFLRPPVFPPQYSVISQPAPTATAMMNNGLINNMITPYQPYQPIVTISNNNSMISGIPMQPYKKMKTT